MGLMGVMVLVAGIMISLEADHDDALERGFFLSFGLAATVGPGLAGLYLLTRWHQVSIDHGQVIIERGWCLWRSSRRHDLQEFAGLHRYSRMLGAMTGGSSAATALGIAAATATGFGFIASGNVTFHFLELIHRTTRSQNTVLTGSTDLGVINGLAEDLSGKLKLPLLMKSMDGYVEQLPLAVQPAGPTASAMIDDRLPASVVPAALPAVPLQTQARSAHLSSAPPGVRVTVNGSTTRILLPVSRKPLLAGLALGIPFGGVGLLALVLGNAPGLVPLGIGAVMLLVGWHNSKRGHILLLSDTSLHYQPAAMGTKPMLLPWDRLRDVSVARTSDNKPAMLLVTSGADAWLATDSNVEVLEWLAQVIRQRLSDMRAGCAGPSWQSESCEP
jgi:hypothetical protein